MIPIVKKIGIFDSPDIERKIHKTPAPLLGGIPIFVSLIIMFLAWHSAIQIFELAPVKNFSITSVFWVFLGLCVIILGGVLDDIYNLKAWQQIIFPVAAILVVIYGGINITKITNPFDGILFLPQWAGYIVTFLWLIGMIYTTKILDGLDGLATGITAIGAIMIAILSLFTKWYQPDIATAALIVAGVCVGFLIFNFHPARIFLGEGGSLMLGFILGVLAIISGSKIMTTLLVVGLPVIDVAWAIIRRIVSRMPVARGDRLHMHHLMLDGGFSHRGAVLFLYAVAFLFGLSGIFLSSEYKLLILIFLAVFTVALLAFMGAFKRAP